MLRLCPGDNLSQRTLLPTQLATSGRYEQTLRYAQAWIEDDASHPDGKASPSQEPLTAERIEAFTARKWTKAEYFYSSALAAFRLWGDCELARQYLYIGARLNPQILIRIMAKVKKPRKWPYASLGSRRGLSNPLNVYAVSEHINIRPRAPNSPEDAQDYLFTAQDTWMEPDVWMWASGQQDVQPCIMKQCTRDGCSNHEETVAQFKRCASCHLVFYCSRDCQKADWKFHKPGEHVWDMLAVPLLMHAQTRVQEVSRNEELQKGGYDPLVKILVDNVTQEFERRISESILARVVKAG